MLLPAVRRCGGCARPRRIRPLRRGYSLSLSGIRASLARRLIRFLPSAPSPCAFASRCRKRCGVGLRVLLLLLRSCALWWLVRFTRSYALESVQCARGTFPVSRLAAGLAVGIDLPALRPPGTGDHADGCLHVFLRLSGLPRSAQAEARRLLRFLQLWLSGVSTEADRGSMLRVTRPMSPNQAMQLTPTRCRSAFNDSYNASSLSHARSRVGVADHVFVRWHARLRGRRMLYRIDLWHRRRVGLAFPHISLGFTMPSRTTQSRLRLRS